MWRCKGSASPPTPLSKRNRCEEEARCCHHQHPGRTAPMPRSQYSPRLSVFSRRAAGAAGVGRGGAAGAGVEIAVAEVLVVVLGVGWWRRSFVLLWMLCTRYVFVHLTHLLQNQPRSENPLCREARTVVHRCLPRLLWPWPYLSLVLNNITMRILTRMRIRKSNSSKKSNVMFLFVMWTLVVTSSAIVRRFDEGCYC